MHLSRVLYDLLEIRVGTALTSQMSDDQLSDFERFVDTPDSQDQALEWLQLNIPTYRDIVGKLYNRLIDELVSSAAETRDALNEPFPD